MSFRRRLTAVLVVAGIGVGLSGCAQAEAAGGEEANLNGNVAKVEAIEGSPLSKVTLSPEAVERLGIATGVVTVQPITKHTVVPYSAVIYDANGAPFVYTVPQPNTFVRSPVTVTDVGGDLATINTVLPVGTQVVTVGVSELLGTETGVGDE
ncbi:MAG TPA: hypothetical protein VL595_18465 [Pseudonocardia sp.]|jgi:hypothetical protein|nr:hypothetical protein [Pseudonocardia sp.]